MTPTCADIALEDFRKEFPSTNVYVFDGYMSYLIRYPLLAEYEKKAYEIIKRLNLPLKVKVQREKSFMGNVISIIYE